MALGCGVVDEIIDILWNPEIVLYADGLQSFLEQPKIISLLRITREVLLKQSMLIELDPPVNICGDIHGQYMDLLQIFKVVGDPCKKKYLFLGDYVDRGRQSLECICLLFAYKVKYPQHFFLLRGNHEDSTMNKNYGFFDECKRRYSIKLWKCFIDVFKCLPIAAVVGKAIFCCHGGLSPSLRSLDQIRRIQRPREIPDTGLMCDLLWADPNTEEIDGFGWKPNLERGISYVFGRNIVRDFLKKFKLDLVCRAHEVVQHGYEFFADKGLVTVFSAPLYTGSFDNDAAVMSVDSKLKCCFHILRPIEKYSCF